MRITLWGFWVPWSGVPFGNLGGISGGSWVNFGCEGYLFWGLWVTYWVFEYLLGSRGSWDLELWGVPLEVPEVPSRGRGSYGGPCVYLLGLGAQFGDLVTFGGPGAP